MAYDAMMVALSEWLLHRKHRAIEVVTRFMQLIITDMSGHLDALNQIEVSLQARDRSGAAITISDKPVFYEFAMRPATKKLLDLVVWVKGAGAQLVEAVKTVAGESTHIAFVDDPVITRATQ
eukprot:7891371-Pyramimonas_sp.AAC.1